jgi:hypothetical protein
LAAFDSSLAVPSGVSIVRVKHFLCELLRLWLPDLDDVPAVGHSWPEDLDPAFVPWRTRTRNALINAGVLEHLDRIPVLTFGQLSRLRNIGEVGILDFLATLESVELHLGNQASSPPPPPPEAPPAELEPATAEVVLRALDEDWVDEIGPHDSRFASLLPPIRGTLFETIDALTTGVYSDRNAVGLIDRISSTLPSIRAKADLIRALPIEEALGELLGGLLGESGKHVKALLARLQLDGRSRPITLEEAGRITGISRERVRQIEKRVRDRLAEARFFIPQIDRGMQLLAEHAPLTPADAAVLLHTHGISKAPFDPGSLIAAATIFGRTPIVHIDRRKGKDLLVREPVSAHVDTVMMTAFRQLGQVGTTNVGEVGSELQSLGFSVPEEEIIQVLKHYAGAVFTQESWFWCPARPECNLLTQVRKMLSVVSPIGIAALREGTKRALRFRQLSGRRGQTLVVPTKSAFIAYLRGHPDFYVSADGLVRSVRPLDYRRELPASEMIACQVLRESPSGVLDRAIFQEACASRGLNRNTFGVLTSYSPILEPLGFGLWTLRGRHVDPSVVEVLRQQSSERPRERRVVDFGWRSNGRLWLAVRLPGGPERVLPHVPAAVGRYLALRDYTARTVGGIECGSVRVYDNGNSSGYAPFLRQSGADEGDVLLAEFDLVSATVTLSLADDGEFE